MALRICISSKFPADSDTVGLVTRLSEPSPWGEQTVITKMGSLKQRQGGTGRKEIQSQKPQIKFRQMDQKQACSWELIFPTAPSSWVGWRVVELVYNLASAMRGLCGLVKFLYHFLRKSIMLLELNEWHELTLYIILFFLCEYSGGQDLGQLCQLMHTCLRASRMHILLHARTPTLTAHGLRSL